MASHLVALQDTAEGRRIAAADSGGPDWRAWGPYLSERAWGTVREDYSGDGSAWEFFPHEHALTRILAVMLDEREFLSPYGLRALSRRHAEEPFMLDLAGARYAVGYESGESATGLFGGNSNWRGPIWFPVNYLVIEALGRYARFFGDDILIEHPAGSGRKVTLAALADDLARRLVSIFLDDTRGRRPVFGDTGLFQDRPDWHDLLPFHEYFHGDTGRGVGASHQTGWTGLVADLIIRTTGTGHD